MKRVCLPLCFVLAVGCGGSDSDRMGPDDPGPGDRPHIEGTDFQYVVSQLVLPADEASANALGSDIDKDGLPDNKLGQTLVILKMLNLDLQPVADKALAKGELTLLLNLRTPSLEDAALAGLWALFGAPADPHACENPDDLLTCGQHLKGGAAFSILRESPTDQFLPGALAGGSFSGGPGQVSVALPLSSGELFAFQMTSAESRFQATSRGLMDGVLGGAITREELDTNVLPGVHQFLESLVTRDCGGSPPNCCQANTTGKTIVQFLDDNKDCKVSLNEFRENSIIQEMFKPDLDLYDADGKFAPNVDRVKDSLSFGLGFAAVNASFPVADLK